MAEGFARAFANVAPILPDKEETLPGFAIDFAAIAIHIRACRFEAAKSAPAA